MAQEAEYSFVGAYMDTHTVLKKEVDVYNGV